MTHDSMTLDKVSNFSNETLIFPDFLKNNSDLFWWRRDEILARVKNRRGKTAGPLSSPLFSSLYFSILKNREKSEFH
jgi:hypothetical protein